MRLLQCENSVETHVHAWHEDKGDTQSLIACQPVLRSHVCYHWPQVVARAAHGLAITCPAVQHLLHQLLAAIRLHLLDALELLLAPAGTCICQK